MREIKGRRTGRLPAWAGLVLAAAVLAGCQHADQYPSPYGPSRPTPLPPVAGGGLWNPAPVRAAGYGATALINRLPTPEPVPAPSRSSQTPELLTPEQQAARRRDLEALRAGHAAAAERRLESQGRVRGPGPGARPAIEEDTSREESWPNPPAIEEGGQ